MRSITSHGRGKKWEKKLDARFLKMEQLRLNEKLTLKEIGIKFNISTERVRQILNKSPLCKAVILRQRKFAYENSPYVYDRKRGIAGGKITNGEWEALKKKHNYTCLRCGKREPEITLTADHVIPISKGGLTTISNIQPLCRACNTSKGKKETDYR